MKNAIENTTTTRTLEAITNDIIQYFKDNEDIFNACMEELDRINGYLENDRYYHMEDLDELYSGSPATEILYRAFYGWDENEWTLDGRGEKVHGKFNPNREYFKYNGYGNLVSTDYPNYSALLDEYAVESMADNRQDMSTIDNEPELEELFDEYLKAWEVE